jgi:hypothetical protein
VASDTQLTTGRNVPAQVPAQAPPLPAPGTQPTGITVPGPSVPDDSSDEEQALVAMLRLVHRGHGPRALLPVERAFIAGAKVVFEQLAQVCDLRLNDTVSNLVPTIAKAGEKPTSVSSQPAPATSAAPAPDAEEAPPEKKTRGSSKESK